MRLLTAFGLFISVFVGITFLQNCQTAQQGVRLEVDAPVFERLSEYQFFVGDMKNLEPNDRVLPYDLNSPLFSDYAEKSRSVWMPPGKAATYREDRAFTFPEGAVLIKNFYYHLDESAPDNGSRIMETRLLINRPAGWDAMTYIWNEEQTEAYLNVVGDIQPVQWTRKDGGTINIDYLIPNRNQCKSCHSYDGEIKPIGPKAHQLNKDFVYSTGTYNQLEQWASVGYLKGSPSPDQAPIAAQWEHPETGHLHDRAMSYLDSNCGHCHNPHGPANTSGLNLVFGEQPGLPLGIFKAPVASGKGSGGRPYSIVPGHPEQSILVYRMESTDPGAMMPELGRQLVHEEGVALIKEWITGME